MASVSVGDIVLCSQIVYRLLEAATIGRRNAPRDIRELDNVLLALGLALDHLCKVAAVVLSQQNDTDHNAGDVQHNLRFMVQSCRRTLEDLERTTFKYRDIMRNAESTNGSDSSRISQVSRLKSQWRRVMWDLRGESFTTYRKKLETHTAVINLMLSTCIWSTANRIESDCRRQSQRLEELLHQAHRLNDRVSTLTHNTRPRTVGAFHNDLEHRPSYPPLSVTSRLS